MTTEVERVISSRNLTIFGVAALGLGVQVVGYSFGSAGHSSIALTLFYTGLVLIYVPCASRLLASNATRRERLQVCVFLGLMLLLSYYMRSPLRFDRFDELLHLATLRQIAIQRHLFTQNSELPISPYYPGLELVTLVAHWGTGLPLVASQLLVLVVSRILLVLGIFLIIERLSGSAHVAGIGVLIYAASPQFYVFNSGFAYQTLALPLALGVIFLLLRGLGSEGAGLGQRFGLCLGCLAALTITHHVVSWITVGLLIVWAIALARSHQRAAARAVGIIAAAGIVFVGGWTVFVGVRVWRYLAPVFEQAYDQVAGYLAGTYHGRQFFQEGVATPDWERVLVVASVLAWLLLIVAAGGAVVKRRTLRDNPLRWVLLIVALSYPLLIAVRFSSEAAEIAERASTFVFFAIALIVGSWFVVAHRGLKLRLAVGTALVLFLGGLILGSGPDWALVPGPYLISADQRSVDALSISATTWAADHLPEGSRIAADRVNTALLGATGRLLPVTGLDGVNVTPIFFSHDFSARDLSLMRSADILYFLVDYRLTRGLPYVGFYFESDPTYNGQHLTMEDLAKFVDTAGVRQIYHNSAISIYNVSALIDRPSPALRVRPPTGGSLDTNGWVLGFALVTAAIWMRRRVRRGRPVGAEDIFRSTLAAVCLMMLLGVILAPINVSTQFISIGILVALMILGVLPRRVALHVRKA